MSTSKPVTRRSDRLSDRLVRCAYRMVYPLWRGYVALFRLSTQGTQVVVWSGDRLLLIRNSYRKDYTFPGGYVARGEDTAAAARRELREETGLLVAGNDLVYRRTWTNTQGRSSDQCTLFECRFDQPPVLHIDHREVIEAQFVTRREAFDLPLAKHVSEYLR